MRGWTKSSGERNRNGLESRLGAGFFCGGAISGHLITDHVWLNEHRDFVGRKKFVVILVAELRKAFAADN